VTGLSELRNQEVIERRINQKKEVIIKILIPWGSRHLQKHATLFNAGVSCYYCSTLVALIHYRLAVLGWKIYFSRKGPSKIALRFL
jgi:hypothetical protein